MCALSQIDCPSSPQREYKACERVDVGLDPGADVDRTRDRPLEGEEVRADDVAHVDVVAGLAAVAVDRDELPAEHLPDEDGDHPRLAVRVLAGPVDVGVAQRDEGQAVLGLVEEGVQLARPLAHAVGAHRVGRMRLRRREDLLLAVDRAARGHEEDPAHARPARGLEQADRAQDVGARIEERVGDRAAHVHLRGVQVQDLRPLDADQRGGARVLDVELVEARSGIQVVAAAGGEVVDDDHLVARGHAGVHHVRADEARAAGHEDLHAPGGRAWRKKSIVRRSPSSSAILGSQPRILRARVMSGCRTLGSSTGSGR